MKIEFNNVSYEYKSNNRKALNNLNLEFNSNEIIFILGHTGSGKSTLLQHLNGLLFPTSGEIKIDTGEHIYNLNRKERKLKNLRKDIGLVFQFPENQLFESTVLKDVMFGPKNFGYSDIDAKRMAIESLKLLGIDERYYDRSPFEISGGEKRKVAIAGVIANNPRVLALDEPTSSLDGKSIRDLFELLERLKERGTMIFIVTHDVNLCYQYADKVLILNDGNVSYYGDYKNAFTDKEVLEKSNIEMPFVIRIKNKLNLSCDARTIEELSSYIKEVVFNE